MTARYVVLGLIVGWLIAMLIAVFLGAGCARLRYEVDVGHAPCPGDATP